MDVNKKGFASEVSAMFDLITEDMHTYSMRPCPTCKEISNFLDRPFGCYFHQAVAQRRDQLKKYQANVKEFKDG